MRKKEFRIVLIIGVIVLLALIWNFGMERGSINTSSQGEQECMNSGGIISTAMCCKSVGDFPNTCKIGACGCSPENSHRVKICDCGEGKCFDGTQCSSFP